MAAHAAHPTNAWSASRSNELPRGAIAGARLGGRDRVGDFLRPLANERAVSPVAGALLRHRARDEAARVGREAPAERHVALCSDALHESLDLPGWRDRGLLGGRVEWAARKEPHRHALKRPLPASYEPPRVGVPAVGVESASDDDRVKVARISRAVCGKQLDLEAGVAQGLSDDSRDAFGPAALGSPGHKDV